MKKKKAKQPKRNLPSGWYFMAVKAMTVGDIKEAFDETNYELEIWREAGVLEIIVADKISIDIEELELDLGDDYSNDYLAKHQVKSLFYVSFKMDAYEECLPALLHITKTLGGRICGDTDDFTPVIK